MKLLTPTNVKINEEKRLSINIKRSLELDSELTRKKNEFNKLEIEFNNSIKSKKEELEEISKEYRDILSDYNNEVKKLEERKKQALLPIEEKWKELEKAQLLINNRIKDLDEKEERLNNCIESLENRIDYVVDRELEAQKLAQKQVIAQQGIDMQKESIVLQNKVLNDSIIKANIRFEEKEKDIERREALLESQQKVINSQLVEIANKENYFITKERELQDRYATLERSIERYESSKKGRE